MWENLGKNKCIICSSSRLEDLENTKKVVYVTGDRKNIPWMISGGYKIKKVICKDCGTIQHLQNGDYKHVINRVYEEYGEMHDKAWIIDRNEYKNRLQVEYELIDSAISLPEMGDMLDIGCGGGESLYWFNQIYPKWNLYGMDIGSQFKEEVTNRNKVQKFYTSLEEVKNSGNKFAFISINNVLSLADNPVAILRTVYDVLLEDGIFFIKDSNFQVHPWLLYEVEACSFYTREHMENVVKSFGFEVLNVDVVFEEKEIGLFCKKTARNQLMSETQYGKNKYIYNKVVAYLDKVIDIVQKYVKENVSIGIFGTSIAGVWLSEIITKSMDVNEKELFYVDEDKEVLQKKIGENGYPIYSPTEIPESAVVFLPFPEYIAKNIKERCEKIYKELKFVSFG